eukprot:gene10929-12752_t
MKDCPYIEFGSVEVNDNSACAPVWSRIAVCRGLYISQEQFLDFVLFLGNDYTAPLVVHTDLYATMHRLFNGNAQIIMQEWLANVSKQRNGLLQASDLFALPPAHYNAAKRNAQMQQIWELQFAMDYSRALYHLEPLDHFYEQASQTLPPTVPYSSASCVFDFHHYSDISEGKFFADLGRYVKAAGKMGTEGVDRGVAVHALTYLKRKCASTASTSTSGPAVTEEHRAAIQVMLQQIQQPSLHDETDKLKPPPPPQWEDLLAAYVYQKTCASMLKSFPKGSFSGEHNAPVQLFNGVLFHAVLIGMRLTAGQHLPEILINERARIEPDVASSSVHSKIAVPHSEPLVVPTCAIALTKAQRKVLLSGKNNLTMPERKALLLQSMDESLSKVQRIALRKEGFSGSMTKKERIEIGIERIKRSSLTKEERKALRKQKASSKTMVPSNPARMKRDLLIAIQTLLVHVAFGLLSRASATQRAGRTGRVRPGTVYRLYKKETYNNMKEHELAEVLRRPLEDVVLNMWAVLENAQDFQGVTPFLHRLIEVPNVRYIDKSYEKLFEASLITFPSDDGCLTPAGRFISTLPLDLSLGRMLSYGVLLGVSAEAVVLAAALSLSRSPYRIASSLFLDPNQFNNHIRRRCEAEDRLDQGNYSESIALIRLLLEWRALDSDKVRNSFCHKNNLQSSVMKQFDSTAVSLARETGRMQPSPSGTPLQINVDSIGTISPHTVNILRLIMVWSFSENILQLQRNDRKLKEIREAKGTFRIESDRLTSTHLEALYGRIPYVLTEHELDLCYSFSHKIDPFPQLVPLVDRLATVSDRNGARCFAIILESPDPEISEVFFIALPHETQSYLVEQFHCDVLSRERVADNQLALQLLNQCSNINQTDIVFTCSDASQSEVSNLFEFQRRLGDIITI